MAQLEPIENEARALEQILEGEFQLRKALDDLAALKLVTQDVAKAEASIQTRAMDTKWQSGELLFLAKLPTVVWEGTNVTRANLGVPLVYEHLDSILAQTMNAIFSEDPPFTATPPPSVEWDAGRVVPRLIGPQLKEAEIEEEVRYGLYDGLLHGTGMWKWGDRTIRRSYPVVKHAANGSTSIKEETVDYWMPTFEHIELRHVLVDPSLRYPDVRKGNWVVHRMYKTIEELDSLRDDPGYTVPAKAELEALAFPPKETPKSGPLENSALNISQEWQQPKRTDPGSVNPLLYPLEVLEYWNKDRVIVTLNRKFILRNERNAWGRLPFLNVYYKRVSGTFWGMGLADLIGGEQKLQQGVLNTFLDGLALKLLPMMKRMRGANIYPQHLRIRPGGVIDYDQNTQGVDPIQPLDMGSIDPNVFEVLSSSDQRAQRRTGANDLMVQGSPSTGRSSVTRTATGAEDLQSAAAVRLGDYIKIFSDQVFIPLLDAFYYMDIYNLKPKDVMRILDQEMGEDWYQLVDDPLEVLNAKVKFEVLAGAKLQQRQALLAAVPQIIQFFQQEPIQDTMKAQSKTMDFETMEGMIFDMAGWKNENSLIRDMNDEEKAQLASENPMIQQLMQQQQAEVLNRQKLQQIEAEHVGRAARDGVKSALKMGEQQQEMQSRVEEELGRNAALKTLNGGNNE